MFWFLDKMICVFRYGKTLRWKRLLREVVDALLQNLNDTINYRHGNILVWRPGGEHDGVSTHEAEGQSPKELAGHLILVQTLASRQGRSQELHLGQGARVKASQGLEGERQEHQSLLPTSVFRVPLLPEAGFVQGGTSLSGSPCHIGLSQRTRDSHVDCHVLALRLPKWFLAQNFHSKPGI